MEQKSGDGAPGKQPAEGPSKSDQSIDEAEKSEQNTETQASPLDERKFEAKGQMYKGTSPGVDEVLEVLSPMKRKCTGRYVVASGKIEPEEKQLKAFEQTPGTSAAGVGMQGSPKSLPSTQAAGVGMRGSPKKSPAIPETHLTPLQLKQLSSFRSSYSLFSSETSAAGDEMEGSSKRSPTLHGNSEAGVVIPGSPKRSPTIPGSTAAGVVMPGFPRCSPTTPGTSSGGVRIQGSPMRSPVKRTYKERQLTCSVDELREKHLKEESGYQSDLALDLRKEFKKQMPSSTQSPERDCQQTSSDKMRELVEKLPEEKCATESNFPRDPKSASSGVTSSDVEKADGRSTSNESVVSSTGEVAPRAQGCQVQSVAEANKKEKSPLTSPQRSGARPKETAGGSRSVDSIEVSYARFSPSRMLYGEPTIRRISPQRAGPSGSDGGFKVPYPPPPPEDRNKQPSNLLETYHSCVEFLHAMVTAEQLQEQIRKEKEEKEKREREQAENLVKAQLQARETTKKLKEKEARLKGENKLSAEDKSDIARDEAVAGPSTSGEGMTAYGPEGYFEVKSSVVDKQATTPCREEHKITEPIAEKEKISAAQPSLCDENANIMEGEPPLSAGEDDNENKSQTCTVQTNREGTEDDARPSAGGVVTQRPHEVPRNPAQVPLQQLDPAIDEMSFYADSLENVAATGPEEDDNAD